MRVPARVGSDLTRGRCDFQVEPRSPNEPFVRWDFGAPIIPPTVVLEIRDCARNSAESCSRSVPLVAGSGSEEGGERAAGLVGGEEIAEVDQEGAVLQAAGDRRREGASGEPFAVV